MSAEAQADTLVGTVLEGAYRITRLLGRGGMGAVYEAVQLRLDKRVAVKLMAQDLAANHEALARFHREAEITSHLGHPHLVNVIDFGQAESGEPYLVMEYLDGEDLDHRLRRVGQMPIEAVVHVVRQVASALGAAHDQGVVHRDLKPGNVFLLQIPGEPDFVKVLDFGISKVKAARTQLTSASAVMGTPNYMSPEQATGMVDEIDHRTDEWALGCIAWEMLFGRGPFVADDVAALLYQIINLDPQPLATHLPGLPPAVEMVLRQALSKRPADRFPSIREFARALEAAAIGRPADATPAPVMLSMASLPGATVAYGNAPVVLAPALTPVRPAAARTPRGAPKSDVLALQVDEDLAPLAPPRPSPPANPTRIARKPGAQEPPFDQTRLVLRRRIKSSHAIIAAIGVLLLLGAFLRYRFRHAARMAKISVPQPWIAPQPPAPPSPAMPEPSEATPVAPHAKRAKGGDPFTTGEFGKSKPARNTPPVRPTTPKLIEDL
jgi:serine/threonine-protein kinase